MEEKNIQIIPYEGRHEAITEAKPALHGAIGWSALLISSILQLAAVSVGCVGAVLRWFGRNFIRSGSDALRTGRHLRERVEVEWDD